MATTLPLELIHLIIASAYPFDPDTPVDIDEGPYAARCAFLRAAALVHSDWTAMAQELLWVDVCLSETRTMAAFTRARKLPVRRLTIVYQLEGGEEVEVGHEGRIPLGRLLEGVCGVDDLAVIDDRPGGSLRPRLALDCLRAEGYKGQIARPIVQYRDILIIGRSPDLTSLCLEGGQPALNETTGPFPFALTHLKLDLVSPTTEPSFEPLLALLCHPSLTSLDLCYTDDPTDSSLLALLPIAAQLTTLVLSYFPNEHRATTSFFLACASLRYLTTLGVVEGWIEALPVALEHWTLLGFRLWDMHRLHALLKKPIIDIALSKLTKLELPPHFLDDPSEGRADPGAAEMWEELEEIWRERGVQVVAHDH